MGVEILEVELVENNYIKHIQHPSQTARILAPDHHDEFESPIIYKTKLSILKDTLSDMQQMKRSMTKLTKEI